MSPEFKAAAEALIAANEQFAARNLSPVGHRDAREAALAKGLLALAAEFGVRLQEPVQVDSRGEVSIVALHPDGRPTNMGSGPFGGLAEVLNRYSPRTGVNPGAVLIAENGWCRMNHFGVEKMLLDRHQAQMSAEASAAGAAPAPKRKARP